MLKRIERLRHEPKTVRDRYAFYAAFLFTAVIAAVWVTSLPSKFAAVTEETKQVENDETGGFGRALVDIRSQVAAAIATVKEQLPDETESEVADTETQLDLNNNKLDFAAMFATSTETEVATATEEKKVGRTVIIATTSSPQKTASSSQ